ncbi:MAG: phosphate ABC transporter permease PstA [bacterium JZ-2024 1]
MKSYLIRKLYGYFVFFLCGLSTFTVISLLSVILIYIFYRGFRAVDLDFFTQLPKPVGEPGGGMANAIIGTCILVGLASLIGIPVGIFTGIFYSEFAERSFYGRVVRFSSDVFTGISSVAIGVFVYTLIVLPMKKFTALAGGVALAIILIPIVASATVEMLRMVPGTIREAGLALGIPTWKVTLHIVLRSSAPGIATATLLGIARIAGETAPLLFTSFNNRFWNINIFEPIASLPVMIFTYAIAPYEDWHRQAWAAALVLVSLILALNFFARYLAGKQVKLR